MPLSGLVIGTAPTPWKTITTLVYRGLCPKFGSSEYLCEHTIVCRQFIRNLNNSLSDRETPTIAGLCHTRSGGIPEIG